ncbi:MAG: NADH-quinone oxidoreductase chain 1, partial [Planctomycetota bacterium]
MKLSEPILTKRIPTAPFGDPKQRHTVGFDEYVKTGGYQALEKALSMEPTAVVNTVKDAIVRGRG